MANRVLGIREGFLDIAHSSAFSVHPQGQYFICGPTVFIQKQFQDLVGAGVKKENIHFEEFGPQTLSLN